MVRVIKSGYSRNIQGVYIGTMEKKMETTIIGLYRI